MLLVVCCLLVDAGCGLSLFVVRCLLVVVRWLLCVVCCMLYVGCWCVLVVVGSVFVGCCLLFVCC